jgi:hypothetical protein
MAPFSDAVCQAAKWLKSSWKGNSPKFISEPPHSTGA